ncbi:MAG TPA: DUF2252 domain-containing protein [Acidimicrobiales bacterium]|nr:DUF2252 domain-containing protein [Acidimicrobiales bacterium]
MKPEPTSPQDRRETEARTGRELRTTVPRSSHGEWKPAPDRPDPVELLDAQNTTRLPQLVPVRWGRMLESPFAFLRGSAALMAADLASTPATGVNLQICGDAHLANFGVFASPERRLLFDVNDFDETTAGPWEWDLKRLVASAVVAARSAGLSRKDQEAAANAAARSYRTRLAEYAAMGVLDAWYASVDADAALRAMGRAVPESIRSTVARARRATSEKALPRLTELSAEGQRRIVDHPPVVSHDDMDLVDTTLRGLFRRYRETLEDERRVLLDRFEIVDFAQKVVGVGSVGTRCFIALLLSDLGDPLFLQVKEADRSALDPYLSRHEAGGARRPGHTSQGRRVVDGQRLMQAASDIFLGWVDGVEGVDYYVRQLRDMKGSVDTASLASVGFDEYAQLCGWALARAHARSGRASLIAGYAGTGAALDIAMTRFALAYADQVERDHAQLAAAVKSGRVVAETGV